MASIVAALFDHLSLPWPDRRDAACTAAVDTPVFAAFLGTHAAALTPLARCYLAGMGDAGPGERSLTDRHAGGMRAVLRNHPPHAKQPPHAAHLGVELPLRHTEGYPPLIDIDGLESYFAAEHRPDIE